jgi:hypothetical protein
MLIKCPECGIEVSSLAEKCPKCAFPLTKSTKAVKSEEQGAFITTLNLGCQIILVIGILILGYIFFQLNGCS